MMKKNTLKIILIAAIASVSLMGCKKLAEKVTKASMEMNQKMEDAAKQNAAGSQEDKVIDVMNTYVSASNTLIPFRGTYEEDFEKYKKQNFAETTKEIKEVNVYFEEFKLRNALKDLEEARKTTLGAPYDKLEAATDEFIPILKTFHKTVEALNKYAESKEYLEDKGEFAKKQDAEFIAQAEKFIIAYNKFSSAHHEATLIHGQEYIKSLRAQGLVREACLQEAFTEFKLIASLFDSEEDLNDEAKRTKMEEHLNNAKTFIDNLETENAKINDDESSDMKRAHEDLNELLGVVREFKSNGYKSKDFERFIDKYNHFVKFTLNMM